MNCIICRKTMNVLVADLWICQACGLVSSSREPDPTIYDRSYAVKYQRYERTAAGRDLQEIRYLAMAGLDPDGKGGRTLDFGCGSGHFVRHCLHRGWYCIGFDINPHSGFCDVGALFGRHSTVTFWDSLEHLRDPGQVIRGLLPKHILVSTPNIDAFDGPRSDLVKWHHYYPEEHVHYFGGKSLAALLEFCGYRVVLTEYDESEIRTGGGPYNIITMGAILTEG